MADSFCFDPESSTSVEESHPILAKSSPPASSYSLRNRNQSKLIYDLKYHPMDDSIRPTQAAKRRSAHGEKHVCCDSDDSSEVPTVINTNTEESGGEQSENEEQPKKNTRGTKRKIAFSRSETLESTRRSPRKVSDPKTSYNMNVHPQDKFLVISSDEGEESMPKNKHRKTTRRKMENDPGSDEETATSKSGCQKKVHGIDYLTSHGLESTGELIFSPVEVENGGVVVMERSPSSPVAMNQGDCIRRREGMDVWNLSPGERYSPHGQNSWPFSHGQPFEIFHEKLEDHLAREALAESPLIYEHDDKENATNNTDAERERLSVTHDGVSIIPAAHYVQSSDDRKLSCHRALVNNILYDDPIPETYGLDGTYCHRRETNALAECMNLLASGGDLPSR